MATYCREYLDVYEACMLINAKFLADQNESMTIQFLEGKFVTNNL